MTTRKPTTERVPVKGVTWKRSVSIAADKYDRIAKAILAELSSEPIKFQELVRRVERRLPDFDGSVSWYTITVARTLEAQGAVVRSSKPVLYSKPARHRAKKSPA